MSDGLGRGGDDAYRVAVPSGDGGPAVTQEPGQAFEHLWTPYRMAYIRGEGKPTANIYPIFEDLKKELKAETDRLEETLNSDLAAFNTEAKRAGVEVIAGGTPPVVR